MERRHGAGGDLLRLSRGPPVSSLYCAVIRCAEVSFCSEDVFVHMSFPQKTCTFEIIRTVSDDEYFRPLCVLNESFSFTLYGSGFILILTRSKLCFP